MRLCGGHGSWVEGGKCVDRETLGEYLVLFLFSRVIARNNRALRVGTGSERLKGRGGDVLMI